MKNTKLNNKLNKAVNGVDIDDNIAFGPVFGIFIIVALILVGGLYFWQTLSSKIPVAQVNIEQTKVLDNPAGTSPSFEILDTVTTDTPATPMTDAEFDALINGSTDTAILEATTDNLNDIDSIDAEFDALELSL